MKINPHKICEIQNSLTTRRIKYFHEVASLIPKFSGKFIVLTHILEDRPEILSAISSISKIALVIAIPYSIDKATLNSLRNNYTVLAPTLEQLLNKNYLLDTVKSVIHDDENIIILEIGGYFSQILNDLKIFFNGNFVGVIESTESGHRQYEKLKKLPCPVLSVSRGSLKRSEYSVVGASCVFSTENLLRQAGFLIQGKKALIIGYGKVGQGLARSLYKYNCTVSIYDKSAISRTLAYSEGFNIPDKNDAIEEADIVFGASGDFGLKDKEITLLKTGSILVSCSSKNIEFDMSFIKKNYSREIVFKNFDIYFNEKHFFYLLGEGTPINFIDGAVMGPILTLVQGEIIYAIKSLLELKESSGIFEVSEKEREMLAQKWLNYFGHKKMNSYFEVSNIC